MNGPRPLRLTVYRGRRFDYRIVEGVAEEVEHVDWRWRMLAGNGREVASSTEGYTSRAGVEANLLQTHGIDIAGLLPGLPVEIVRVVVTRRATDLAGDTCRSVVQHIVVEVLP